MREFGKGQNISIFVGIDISHLLRLCGVDIVLRITSLSNIMINTNTNILKLNSINKLQYLVLLYFVSGDSLPSKLYTVILYCISCVDGILTVSFVNE